MILVYNPQITSSDRKAFGRRGNEQEQHLGGTDLVEGHQEGFRSHEWGTFLKRDNIDWLNDSQTRSILSGVERLGRPREQGRPLLC